MGERKKPTDKVKESVSAEKVSGPADRLKETPSPKKALQGSMMKALKVPGLRKILHSLAWARLVKVLRMIVGFIGIRAVPVIALIIGGWIFRRFRKR